MNGDNDWYGWHDSTKEEELQVTIDALQAKLDGMEIAYSSMVLQSEVIRAKLDIALDGDMEQGKVVNHYYEMRKERDTLQKKLGLAIEYIKDDIYTDKHHECEELLKKLEE